MPQPIAKSYHPVLTPDCKPSPQRLKVMPYGDEKQLKLLAGYRALYFSDYGWQAIVTTFTRALVHQQMR